MEKDTIALIFIIFVIIAIIGAYFAVTKLDRFKNLIIKEQPKEEQQIEQIQYYNMNLYTKSTNSSLIDTNYTLKQSFQIVKQGEIKSTYIEQFVNAIINVTYNFYAYNDDYYMNTVSCYNQDLCEIILPKKANVSLSHAIINDNKIRIIIETKDGMIKKPIVCVSHNSKFVNLRSEIPEMNKPQRLIYEYDKCYNLNTDLNEGYQEFNIEFDKTNIEVEPYFKVGLFDLGFDNAFSETYEVDNNIRDIEGYIYK